VGRIPDDDIHRVRDATDVVALVSESVVLKQKGRIFWGLCPFHGEKTPSFKVDPATGLWHCFGCGAGGDAFGFLMQQEGLEFPDAVRELARRTNVEIRETGGGLTRSERDRLIAANEAAADFYHAQLTQSRDPGAAGAREYLTGRGFGIDVAKRFELGYAPDGRATLVRALEGTGVTRADLVAAGLALEGAGGELRDRFFGRVVFPIRDVTGHAVGFGGRVLGDAHPKYLNTQETPVFHKSRTLYALDRAKNEIVQAKTSVVVEGYTDVIALHEAGMRNAVATLGTALTEAHVRALSRFSESIVYLFDGDEAGRRAAARAGEFLKWQATPERRTGRVELLVAMIPEGMDPADYVVAHGVEALGRIVEGAQPLLRFILDLRLDEHDLDSPEGRSRALASAAGVLAGLKDSILGQDYANHVASRLQVDYATVHAAMETALPEVTLEEKEEAGPAPSVTPMDAGVRAEREVLKLIAGLPELRAQARDLLDGELMSFAAHRETARIIVDSGDATGVELLDRLRAGLPDAEELVGSLVGEIEKTDETLDVFGELIDRLKEFRLRRQILHLQAELEGMDPVKDKAGYDDVFERVAALQRELKARPGDETGDPEGDR
jgi:DNA primase